MAKFYSLNVLDNGLAYVGGRITAGKTLKIHLIKAYTQGDSYATVAGNSLGSNLVALVSGDLALANQGTYGRKLTIASKDILITTPSGASPDLHIAVLNETDSEVLLVNDETTNEVLVAGQARTIPAAVFNSNQPT